MVRMGHRNAALGGIRMLRATARPRSPTTPIIRTPTGGDDIRELLIKIRRSKYN